MKNILPRILAIAGFTAVSTGLWMWSHIAALIIGGLIVCAASMFLMARNLLAQHYVAALEKQRTSVNVQAVNSVDRNGVADRVAEVIKNGARISRAN